MSDNVTCPEQLKQMMVQNTFFLLLDYGTKSCCIKKSPISILMYVARIGEKGKVCERWVVRCYFLRTFREAQVALSIVQVYWKVLFLVEKRVQGIVFYQ